jgi:hypothetical protein
MLPDTPWLKWLSAAFTLLATLGSTFAFWGYLVAFIENKTGIVFAELPHGELLEYLFFFAFVLLIALLIRLLTRLSTKVHESKSQEITQWPKGSSLHKAPEQASPATAVDTQPAAIRPPRTAAAERPVNPYDPWHPALPPAFVGRRRILRKLEEASWQGAGVSLVGDWRTGKSSILATFAAHADTLGIPVRRISGQDGAAADHRQFTAAVLGGAQVGLLPQHLPASADATADRLDAWCRDIGNAGNGRPTILLDEATAFLERCDRRFLERLRGLLQASRLALVFATRAPLGAIRDGQGRTSPFANQMELERVGLLDAPAAKAIIARGAALWQADDRDWLLHWAGLHAFYLTLLAGNLFEARRDGEPRNQALDRFRDKAAVQLNLLWSHLDAPDRERLRLAARGQPVIQDALRRRGLLTADGQPFASVLSTWLNEID